MEIVKHQKRNKILNHRERGIKVDKGDLIYLLAHLPHYRSVISPSVHYSDQYKP